MNIILIKSQDRAFLQRIRIHGRGDDSWPFLYLAWSICCCCIVLDTCTIFATCIISLLFVVHNSESCKANLELTDKAHAINQRILIMERKRSSGFHRIFTWAFLLFLAPGGVPLTLREQFSNPAGQSFTLPNQINLPKATVKIRRNPLLWFVALVSKTKAISTEI